MTIESRREEYAWSRKAKALATGLLAAAMMVATSTIAATPAHAIGNIHTVNDFGDQPDTNPGNGICSADIRPGVEGCTLRAAIQESNANPGADRINFNLPFLAPIQPRSQLPAIRNQTTIDGYTQTGSSPNTLAQGDDARIRVEVNGRFAGNADGLVFQQSVSGDNFSNSVVQGLAINHFAGDGIFVSGGLGMRIQGNFIGTDTSGTQDRGNLGSGIQIRESVGSGAGGSHVIGDGTPASRNVISGNEGEGISIFGGPSNIKIQGNYIGTDKDGTNSLTDDDMGNEGSGVAIFGGSNNNTVGGTAIGQGNVISKNDRDGVTISSGSGTSTAGNKVLGNRIGTDRTGKMDLGNGANGFGNGVFILGAANNSVGDGTSGGSNIIAFNGRAGVDVDTSGGEPNGANANRILTNSIFSNDLNGITLGNSGKDTPTPNDTGDADVGPNGFQNYPDITSATTSSTATTINAKLNSEANTSYIVQFFSNPSGTDEGKTFIGQKTVSTDGSGNVSFSFQPTSKVTAGQNITATATRNLFNILTSTSEFSVPKTVALASGSDLSPETNKVSGPSGVTKSPTAHFKFASPDPKATFECSLDGEAYYECTSPENIQGLSRGEHTFRVRAVDGEGTLETSPAVWVWAFDRKG